MNEQTQNIVQAVKAKLGQGLLTPNEARAMLHSAEGIGVKVVDFAPKQTLIIVKLGEGYEDPDQSRIELIRQQVKSLVGDADVLVVPPGLDVHVTATRGVYHREVLGDYEIECVAENELALRARLEYLGHHKPANS